MKNTIKITTITLAIATLTACSKNDKNDGKAPYKREVTPENVSEPSKITTATSTSTPTPDTIPVNTNGNGVTKDKDPYTSEAISKINTILSDKEITMATFEKEVLPVINDLYSRDSIKYRMIHIIAVKTDKQKDVPDWFFKKEIENLQREMEWIDTTATSDTTPINTNGSGGTKDEDPYTSEAISKINTILSDKEITMSIFEKEILPVINDLYSRDSVKYRMIHIIATKIYEQKDVPDSFFKKEIENLQREMKWID